MHKLLIALSENYSQQSFEVHLFSVQVALGLLSIPLDIKDKKFIRSRIHKLQQCLNTIDSILGMSESTLATKLRYNLIVDVLCNIKCAVILNEITNKFSQRLYTHF